MAEGLGEKMNKRLRNHGFRTAGATGVVSCRKLHLLESGCKGQLKARAWGENLEFVPEHVFETHAQGLKDSGSFKLAFRALVRRMLRQDSSFIL